MPLGEHRSRVESRSISHPAPKSLKNARIAAKLPDQARLEGGRFVCAPVGRIAFHPLQVVAPNILPIRSTLARLSARVSAECQGKHLAQPGNREDHGGITHRGGTIFSLAFGGSDKTAYDRMPVVMAQTGDAASSRVVGALQDLVGRYLDPLALGGDPIATFGIRLVVGQLTIARW